MCVGLRGPVGFARTQSTAAIFDTGSKVKILIMARIYVVVMIK